jgi:diguanylate cyclase (GGDEF)-like protein
VRKVDTVSRLGGDEFIVLLPEILGDDTPEMIAQRIIGAVSVPFNISGKEITLSTSIGIAVFPDDAPALHQLIKCADAAMYHVKQSGRNGCCRYRTDIDPQAPGNE